MKLFLKLKAWQMFLLIIFPTILPTMILNGLDGLKWFGIIMLLWVLALIGWMYSVGSNSNQKLPEHLKKSMFIYRLGYIIVIFYSVLIALQLIPGLSGSNTQSIMPPWAIILHLASMFGMFYGLWFTAKQFVTFQKGEKVTFLEYSGPFFLFWFFPLGVWFLQPKINEMFSPNLP